MPKKHYRTKIGSQVMRKSQPIIATVLESTQNEMTVEIFKNVKPVIVKKIDWKPYKKEIRLSV